MEILESFTPPRSNYRTVSQLNAGLYHSFRHKSDQDNKSKPDIISDRLIAFFTDASKTCVV